MYMRERKKIQALLWKVGNKMEKNRFFIVVLVFVGLILVMPLMSLFQAKGSIDDIEKAINSAEIQLVYFGSNTCPYCAQYDPVIKDLASKGSFKYIYIDIDKLTATEHTKLLQLIGKENGSFGVPYTILVGGGRVINELRGYNDENVLNNFLVSNGFIEGTLNKVSEEADEKIDVSQLNEELIAEIENMLNSESKDLLILGSSTCPYCTRFTPVVENVAREIEFDYIYVEIDKESRDTYFKIVELLDLGEFGVPYSLVLSNGSVTGELSGYREKEDFIKFLYDEEIVE